MFGLGFIRRAMCHTRGVSGHIVCVYRHRMHVSLDESELAEDAAVPGRKRRGLTPQARCPRIEAVRWGSIDQQGGVKNQQVESTDSSHVRGMYAQLDVPLALYGATDA